MRVYSVLNSHTHHAEIVACRNSGTLYELYNLSHVQLRTY